MSAPADKTAAAAHNDDALPPDHPVKPDSPSDLRKPTWLYVVRSTIAEFGKDKVTDLAAGLTYYTVLSIFPGLLAMVSLVRLLGQDEVLIPALQDLVEDAIPNQEVANTLVGIIQGFMESEGAIIALVLGIATALWAASNYVGAFSRAMNQIYQVTEGRGFVKLKAQQLGLTVLVIVSMLAVLFIVATTEGVAMWIGDLIGLGTQTVWIWGIAKWPLLLVVVMALLAALYYWAPNVRQPKFRWVSVGAIVAVLIALAAVGGFSFYVANFANYNKTYGTLAGVIIGLFLLWLINVALLFGAELDAELERGRQLQAGMPAERQLLLPMRDPSGADKAKRTADRLAAAGHELRGEVPPET